MEERQEHKHNGIWCNGNERKYEGQKAYEDENGMNTPLGVWGFSKMSDEGCHLKSVRMYGFKLEGGGGGNGLKMFFENF